MELAQARKLRTQPRTGGRALADALVAQRIDHVFAVPGESYLDVLDGLYAVRDRLKLVTCRFEAGAVNMAEAFGKLSGRPAAAMVTRGPGACHGAIGVHIAAQDQTPLLLFVGQIPFEETDRDSFQEIDYRRMFGPLAKWVTQIDDARRIPEIVAHAVDVATTGRPGPVVIALSEEMQRDMVEVPDLRPCDVARPHPDPAALARLRAMLGARATAAGGARRIGVERGGARRRCAAFLRAWHLPVAVGFRRQALYDGTADNFVGDLGVGCDPALVERVARGRSGARDRLAPAGGGDAGLYAVRSRGRNPDHSRLSRCGRDRARVPRGLGIPPISMCLPPPFATGRPTRRPLGGVDRRFAGTPRGGTRECPTTRAS